MKIDWFVPEIQVIEGFENKETFLLAISQNKYLRIVLILLNHITYICEVFGFLLISRINSYQIWQLKFVHIYYLFSADF